MFTQFRGFRCAAPTIAAAIIACALITPANAELIYGVTEQDVLLTWDSATPGTIISGTTIMGLGVNERVQSIDFRPSTGELYAIGSHSRLYKININTGVATAIGGPFSTMLNGGNFGMDFNPVVDLIRITSNADQNLRVDPNTGAVVASDPFLAYASGDPNFGLNPNVTHSTYNNNFPGAQSTLLFGIDAGLDILVQQDPANAGTLHTVGSLGINIAEDGGFDISGVTGIAYAALRPNTQSVSYLYSINLGTGAATLIGEIGGGVNIRAMTIAPIPAPGTLIALAAGVLAVRTRRRPA